MGRPTLLSKRLVLRPFTIDDAAAVQELAGDYEVADTTLRIPHPYEDGMAEQWISQHRDSFREGTNLVLAVELAEPRLLIGAIELTIDGGIKKAELGYWIGRPYWNNGYATEAGRRIVEYGFKELGLNRIAARHMVRNPASGRVMRKIGMSHEGMLRQDTIKWGRFEDLEIYSILHSEWSAANC